MAPTVKSLQNILNQIPSTWDARVPLWLETPEEENKLKRLKKDAINELKLRWNLFREDTHEHFRRQVGQVAALVQDGILTKVSELLVDDDGLYVCNRDVRARQLPSRVVGSPVLHPAPHPVPDYAHGIEAHHEHASLPPLWEVARFSSAHSSPEPQAPQPFRHTVLRPGPPNRFNARLQPDDAPPQPYHEEALGRAPVLGRRAALYYSFAR
ncbi:uncharacterized protein JCM10292_003959 [Rhodotorula paludigena]|uniref:uncharacterized protein n=1 Tax=Rhodotorula paludigena TaxID=86838 RepID=UPI00317AAC66